MSDLDSIVTVTITAEGSGVTRTGFGTMALVTAQATAATPTIDTYTSLAGVAADYAVDSPTYRMARAAFSQSPRPERVKVIKTGLSVAQSVTFTVAAATAGIVTTCTLYRPDGTSATYSYTQAGGDTTTDIAAALAAAINAGETGSPASASLAVVTYANVTDGDLYYISLDANLGTWTDGTADPGYATRLTTALTIDADFYGVVVDCNSKAIIDAVAAWAEANDRLFCYSTAVAAELGASGTIGAGLKSSAYDRTFGLYHSRPWQYAACAWMGARLIDPDLGQKTWAFATLSGVTADTLTPTQRGYLDGDNMSFYVTVAGKNIVFGTSASLPAGGMTASGEWIDIIHGTDWLTARLQEDVSTLIINAGRLPYTQGGIDSVGSCVLKRLKIAEGVGFLAANWSVVTVPKVADISSATKATRILSGVEFTATYAGAIHKTTIAGSLSY